MKKLTEITDKNKVKKVKNTKPAYKSLMLYIMALIVSLLTTLHAFHLPSEYTINSNNDMISFTAYSIGYIVSSTIASAVMLILSSTVIALLYTFAKRLLMRKYYLISSHAIWTAFIAISFIILLSQVAIHAPQ